MDDHLITTRQLPLSFVVQVLDKHMNIISCNSLHLSISQYSSFAINVTWFLRQMMDMCLLPTCDVCEIFWILVCLNFSFSLFRKLFPFFFLISLTLEVLKNFKFQTSSSGKVPLLYAFLMVDFDFVRQECPSFSFSLLDKEFSLNILMVDVSKWVYLCLVLPLSKSFCSPFTLWFTNLW